MNLPVAPVQQPEQPSQDEVNAAIGREQQAHLSYLEQRVLTLSIQLDRAETENARLRAEQPAT